MKMKKILASLSAVALLIGAGCETHKHYSPAEAKISKEEAQQIALQKAPGGTIQESELEKEHGRLVWSFDIARPGTTDITEVQVDAQTGTIVGVETESAEKEAKERMKEQKERR